MLPYSAFSLPKAMPKNQPRRVYGLLGDAHLQEIVTRALLDAALEPSSRDFNLDTVEGEGTTVNHVLSLCGNLPFLSERRVVVVHRAERLDNMHKMKAADNAASEENSEGEEKPDEKGDAPINSEAKSKKAKAGVPLTPAKRLQEGLKKLPATTMLLLLRTPETPEIGARAATARCINAAVDKTIDDAQIGLVIDCTVGKKGSGIAVSILQNEATTRAIPLQNGAAQYLVKRVGTEAGTDIERLLSELEKCALRVGDGETVTRDVIDEMVQRSPQDTIFKLTDAIGAQRGAQAMAILRELVSNGEAPERIIVTFAGHLRKLIQARSFLDVGIRTDSNIFSHLPHDLATQLPEKSNDNLGLMLQNSPWQAQKYVEQARNFSMPQLQNALEAAFATNLAMLGIEGDGGGQDSKDNSVLALELFVAGLC